MEVANEDLIMNKEMEMPNKEKVFRFRVSGENLTRFNKVAEQENVTLSELTRRLLEERAAQLTA